MTVDPEVMSGEDPTAHDPNAAAAGEPPSGSPPVSRATIIWYSLVAAMLFGWFLFGWLVLRQGFVDSVSESVGSAFALLLVVSIVGTLRRSR
jgi:hypothetical protein